MTSSQPDDTATIAGPVLLAYDGSELAGYAIEQAAQLLVPPAGSTRRLRLATCRRRIRAHLQTALRRRPGHRGETGSRGNRRPRGSAGRRCRISRSQHDDRSGADLERHHRRRRRAPGKPRRRRLLPPEGHHRTPAAAAWRPTSLHTPQAPYSLSTSTCDQEPGAWVLRTGVTASDAPTARRSTRRPAPRAARRPMTTPPRPSRPALWRRAPPCCRSTRRSCCRWSARR